MPVFASKDSPIRASYLSWIAKCTIKPALDMCTDEPDVGGVAAQNGSAVHVGIAEFHRQMAAGRTSLQATDAAMDAVIQSLQQFPLADLTECRLFLHPYCADPTNILAQIDTIPNGYDGGGHPDAVRLKPGDLALEVPIRFTLAPHDLDPTKEPIYIMGTLDQIRRQHGRSQVWDAKTGAGSGLQMIHDYAYQLAAYTLGARACGWVDADPGGVIRVKRYREKNAELPEPSGVFWSMPFGREYCETVLDTIRLNIALIRAGKVGYCAGSHCTYCPYRGLDGCLSRTETVFGISLAKR